MSLPVAILRLAVIVPATSIALYLSLFLFQRMTPGIDEWREVARGNAAAGVVMAAAAAAVAIVLHPIVAAPLIGLDLGAAALVNALFLEGVRALLGMLLAVATVAFAAWLYNVLTRQIDESRQLAQGNLAVGLVQAGVIVSTALLLSAPGADLVQALMATFFR